MGRSCSLTTIQAASNCRINSSCPTHWMESSSGWARCRVTPSISTVIRYPSLCSMRLHSSASIAYRKQLFHTPWILRLWSRNPSFLIPTFSRTCADAGFSGRQVAQIRWSPSSPNPKSSRYFAAWVAIPLPQDSGSTRYQISPSSAPLGTTTPQSPTRSPGGPSLIALTMDLQGSDGDSSSESRRNFSLSSREHRGNSMWRTTSILEVKAWRRSRSPHSKRRSLTIAGFSITSIGATARSLRAGGPEGTGSERDPTVSRHSSSNPEGLRDAVCDLLSRQRMRQPPAGDGQENIRAVAHFYEELLR